MVAKDFPVNSGDDFAEVEKKQKEKVLFKFWFLPGNCCTSDLGAANEKHLVCVSLPCRSLHHESFLLVS